jgi:hypothetical protein
MTPSHTLSRLLDAAQLGDQNLLAARAQEHVAALTRHAPEAAAGCQAVVDTWRKLDRAPPGRYLGRFLYRGKPATAYDADGLCGLVLDHLGNGRHSLRVTNPPVPFTDGKGYIDACWLHDDVAVRIEPGTYPALYHLDDGRWVLDHSPSAVYGLAQPLTPAH